MDQHRPAGLRRFHDSKQLAWRQGSPRQFPGETESDFHHPSDDNDDSGPHPIAPVDGIGILDAGRLLLLCAQYCRSVIPD